MKNTEQKPQSESCDFAGKTAVEKEDSEQASGKLVLEVGPQQDADEDQRPEPATKLSLSIDTGSARYDNSR